MAAYPGKRAFDLALVTISAPLWLPALAILACVVRVKIGAPVLFSQQRIGRGERPFRMHKFRSMTDTRDSSGKLLPDTERLTGFGRRLRQTSLDELPELINVLRGEMSLVGPRPLLPQYLQRYSPTHRRRHEVSPGLTGLAQVSGRNAISWQAKFDLDVEYVDSCSVLLDARIVYRTLLAVLRRDGIDAGNDLPMPEFTGYEPSPPSSPAA